MAKSKKAAKQVLDAIEEKAEVAVKVSRRNLLSTGSTLLNLACSGNPYGGFIKGKYYFLVGDSTSGKTFFSMTCFAEAAINKQFKDYDFIYDSAEDGNEMDFERLFGKGVAKRVKAPRVEKGEPAHSFTIQQFYYTIDDLLLKDKKFIYVLDSMDGLTSDSELKKFDEHKTAHKKGKDTPGSMTDGKAKANSEGLRKLISGLRRTGSILIIISQTRDNMGGYAPKTNSGGHALKFYATLQLWTSVFSKITKTIRKKKRPIGNKVKVKVKKNRLTGFQQEILADIYPSYGIDDIGGCIDYLLDEEWWKMEKKSIIAKEFDVTCTRESLIKHIDDNDLYKDLQSITGKCWKEIEKEAALKRKKRYGN